MTSNDLSLNGCGAYSQLELLAITRLIHYFRYRHSRDSDTAEKIKKLMKNVPLIKNSNNIIPRIVCDTTEWFHRRRDWTITIYTCGGKVLDEKTIV